MQSNCFLHVQDGPRVERVARHDEDTGQGKDRCDAGGPQRVRGHHTGARQTVDGEPIAEVGRGELREQHHSPEPQHRATADSTSTSGCRTCAHPNIDNARWPLYGHHLGFDVRLTTFTSFTNFTKLVAKFVVGCTL